VDPDGPTSSPRGSSDAEAELDAGQAEQDAAVVSAALRQNGVLQRTIDDQADQRDDRERRRERQRNQRNDRHRSAASDGQSFRNIRSLI
jgi:hypothetical protein